MNICKRAAHTFAPAGSGIIGGISNKEKVYPACSCGWIHKENAYNLTSIVQTVWNVHFKEKQHQASVTQWLE